MFPSLLTLARSLCPMILAWSVLADYALATPDLRFDVVTFCCPCYVSNHICQPQFDHLNLPTPNGHYIAMGGDTHRTDLATNGNPLAIYYNTLTADYGTITAAQEAAVIDQYSVSGFTTTGPRPDWIILNEISSSLWPSDSTYRSWLKDVVHALKNTYGYSVILYSPFPNPGANAADWQAIAADAYIGIENYLDGSQVQGNGFSVSWCQSQYQSSVNSYTALGVPKARLMLGEHFAQTVAGTSWGRSGISSNNWDTVIRVRNQAAQNVGFAGFLSYSWGGNGMLVGDDELLEHEDTYRTNQLPVNSGITPPFILLQPRDQGVPRGGTASFTVYPAGNTPLTYQWRLYGTNLSGATASTLTVPGVQDTNTGSYTVVLNNTAGALTSSPALLSIGVPPLAYDPFDYFAGANLIGQTDAADQTWTAAGSGANQATIVSGNLQTPGLAASAGNSILYGVSSGPSARFNYGATITNGSVYYSFILKVTDLGALGTSGGFFAALNNSTGTQTTTPSVIAAGVQSRLSGTGFNVGLKKAGSGSVFDTTTYHVGDCIFIVGCYTFNTNSTTDDVASLWINPDPSTFGNLAAPTPTLTSTGSADLTGSTPPQIASFVFFRRGDTQASLQPAAMLSDELRIGTTWASVTPVAPVQVIPALNIAQYGSSVVLSWTTDAPGFTPQATPTLATSSLWTNLTASPSNLGDQLVLTNSLGAGNLFYRLQQP